MAQTPVVLSNFPDPFGKQGKVRLSGVRDTGATPTFGPAKIDPSNHMIFLFFGICLPINLALILSNLTCTPSPSKNKPIANVGIAERHALVRVNLTVEDINFLCQGSQRSLTLCTVGSQSDSIKALAGGRPTMHTKLGMICQKSILPIIRSVEVVCNNGPFPVVISQSVHAHDTNINTEIYNTSQTTLEIIKIGIFMVLRQNLLHFTSLTGGMIRCSWQPHT